MGRAALFRLLRSQSKYLRPRSAYSSGNRILSSELFGTGVIARPVFGSCIDSPAYAAQRRWASKAAIAEDEGKLSIGPRKGEEDDEDAGMVVYEGAVSSTIKKVKLLSLSTCCLSVSLGPVVTFMTNPGLNVILKGAVASTVIILSATTTAALHWFVSPYIHKLRWRPGSDDFEVEVLSWMASPISRTIRFADIRLPETNRPYVTFKADGRFYFVDPERCQNKALLAKLTPQKQPTHPSPFKNV